MNYIIWNKIDKVNGLDANYFIDDLKIRENDGVFLIGTDLDNIQCIEIDRIIKSNYNLDMSLTTEEVAQEYIRIKEEEKLQAEKEQITLEEATDKISILEGQVDTQTTLITNIQNDQLNQDDSIMQGMMGTAEVCEMVIMLQEQIDAMQPTSPVALNLNNKLGGDSAMVEVYANLVLAGKYTCNPNEAVNGVKLVPSVYREQVKAKLNEWAK